MSQDGVFFPPAPYVPPDPLPPGDGAGWPQRQGLQGKPYEQLFPQVNPETDLAARELNLMQWQMGGLGLCAPLAVLVLQTGVVRWAAFTWRQDALVMADFADVDEVAITEPGTGQFQLAFDATQLGSDDALHALTIRAASAAPLAFNTPPGALRAVATVSGSTVNVRTVNAAGTATASAVIVVVH